jgi:hypothetical protein
MNKTAMVMVLFALAAGGCDEGSGKDTATSKGDGEASPSSGKDATPKKSGLDGKELVALAEAYADAACACKKAQCINEAGEKYQADTDKLYSDKKARNPTPEQKKEMDAAQARVKDCTNKLLGK